MVNKHILCRIGVSAVFMALLLTIPYLLFINQSNIATFFKSVEFVVTVTTMVYVILMTIYAIPIITLNWGWYNQETDTKHKISNELVEDIWIYLAILGGALSVATSLAYLITIFNQNTAPDINYLDIYFPYLWAPGVLLVINLIFIGVYYKIGKRVCKVMYGEN
jgi:hypothetical protein